MIHNDFYPVFDVPYYPKYATWEMTLRCNMNCLHCGSRAGKSRLNELNESECLNIAQQLIDMGNEHITLIGGEIFLVPHWYKVAKKFVSSGVDTNIITNGYNVGDKQIFELKESGINDVGVSIDGMEKNHDIIRNRKGSFKSSIGTIKKLKTCGFCPGVATTILDLNFEDLEEMYQLFKDLKIGIWQLQIAAPMGRCSDNRKHLLNPNKVPLITRFIYDKRKLKDGPILLAGDNIGYYDCHDIDIRSPNLDEPSRFTGCGAGLFNIGIDSVGNVKGCESLYSEEFIEGNLREETLYEIWNKKGAFSYNRNFKFDMLHGRCKGCDKGYSCAGGCRQLSYFSSDDKCFYDNIYCSYKNS